MPTDTEAGARPSWATVTDTFPETPGLDLPDIVTHARVVGTAGPVQVRIEQTVADGEAGRPRVVVYNFDQLEDMADPYEVRELSVILGAAAVALKAAQQA